jgi:hypothetical protein
MLAVFWLRWSVERGDNREIEAAFGFAGRSLYCFVYFGGNNRPTLRVEYRPSS